MSKARTSSRQRYQRLKEQGLCPECGKNKPENGKIKCQECLIEYRRRARGIPGKCHYNRTCTNTPEDGKKYCTEHLQIVLQKAKDRRLLAKSERFCSVCGKPNTNNLAVCDECRKRRKEKRDQKEQIMRDLIFNHYGGYKCQCCGETIQILLTLDHKNNDGAEHRKQLGGNRTAQLFKWIIERNFPPIFQVLCWNCNIGKHLNGGQCPHKTVKTAVE